jgi:rubredoxin
VAPSLSAAALPASWRVALWERLPCSRLCPACLIENVSYMVVMCGL